MAKNDKGAGCTYPSDIRLYGIYENKRFLVTLDGVDIWLPLIQYRYFFIMAVYALTSESGWVQKSILDGTSPAINQYLHKLRNEIKRKMGRKWLWPIISQRKGNVVRLRLNDDSIDINPAISILPETNINSPDSLVRKFSKLYIENREKKIQERKKALARQSAGKPLSRSA